jgi:hypothetical protein
MALLHSPDPMGPVERRPAALWLQVPAAQEMTDLAMQRFRKATKG